MKQVFFQSKDTLKSICDLKYMLINIYKNTYEVNVMQIVTLIFTAYVMYW